MSDKIADHVEATRFGVLLHRRADVADVVAKLRRADPGTTSVTEVALTCGLRHLGRFATEYHDRYGEMPSQTLHRPGGRVGR